MNPSKSIIVYGVKYVIGVCLSTEHLLVKEIYSLLCHELSHFSLTIQRKCLYMTIGYWLHITF